MLSILIDSETATRHPITSHWTVDWDVATVIEALEELYPLQAEHKHLDLGSRWQVCLEQDNMEQVRLDAICPCQLFGSLVPLHVHQLSKGSLAEESQGLEDASLR